MELITSKGKILGIINIIDLIILIMLVLMGVIFYKYFIMLDWEKYDFGELAYETVERTIIIEANINDQNILNVIVPGTKEVYRKQIIGIITEKQIILLTTNNINQSNIFVKIKSNLTKVDNDLYYNSNSPSQQLVKLNNDFIFNSEKIKIEGKIINIE